MNEEVLGQLDSIKIVWYKTAEDIHHEYDKGFRLAVGVSEEVWSEMEKGGLDSNEESVEFTDKQMIAGLKKQKTWGFVDNKTRIIHAWADKRAKPEEILHMLTHEVGHLIGKKKRDFFKEEERADNYGLAAKKAYRFMMKRPNQ
jgi:hypothetical protein